jgi:hypothetical protein
MPPHNLANNRGHHRSNQDVDLGSLGGIIGLEWSDSRGPVRSAPPRHFARESIFVSSLPFFVSYSFCEGSHHAFPSALRPGFYAH